MYKLYFLQDASMKYMCHNISKPYYGVTLNSLNDTIDPANFSYGAQSWGKWVASFTVSHTITFDSAEQFKLDYPELLI